MKLREIAEKLNFKELTPELFTVESPEVSRGHVSDLLSDVLANAPAGGVLVTLQVHMNVIAVAMHSGLVAVIFSSDRIPDDEVIKKAAEEGIALFVSEESSFDIAGQLYESGVRGEN